MQLGRHLPLRLTAVLVLSSVATFGCPDKPVGTDDAGTGTDAQPPDAGPDPFDATGFACSADCWCWLHPTPVGNALFGAWMDESGETVVVGEAGTALRFDGDRWQSITCGLDGRSLFAVWGVSPSALMAVGQMGAAYRFDGQCWEPMDTPLTYQDLHAMWGWSMDNVFAVGEEVVLHWDGSQWLQVVTMGGIFFTAVWGRTFSDVYVGGFTSQWDPAPLVHFNGTTWEILPDDPQWVEGIWGADATDFWLVGPSRFVHRDGSGFDATDMDGSWYAVAGTSADSIWAAGERILHYDGQTWSPVTDLDSAGWWVRDLWGAGPDDVFLAASGRLVHYNGTDWKIETTLVNQSTRALWGVGPGAVFAVGDQGTILRRAGSCP